MKLLRILIRDYRGVAELQLEPAPVGVTVAVGPNEIGKTSFKEALELALRFRHDSTHRDVMATKPVHADKGAHVELELESGPYHFTFEKQFHRGAYTTLTVRRPAPESLTGREAHERLEQILDETLDVALFRALSVAQGRAQEQLQLGQQSWISRAFERAASATLSGKDEATLYERVDAERQTYFTPKGKEREALSAKASDVAALELRKNELETALRELEKDVATSAALVEALKRDAAALAAETTKLAELEARLAGLNALRAKLDDAKAAARAAELEEQRAQHEVNDRARLANDLAQARQRVAGHDQELRGGAPQLEQANERSAAARAEWERLDALAQEARARAREAELDDRLVHTENDLKLLRERHAKLQELEREVAGAHTALGGATLDPKRVEELRKLQTELAVAEGKHHAAAAKLVVRARARLELELDGVARVLAPGDSLEVPADSRHTLVESGRLELELRPGADAAALAQGVAKCRDALRAALDRAGVLDLTQAERRLAEQEQARARLASVEQRRKDLLMDLAPHALLEKLSRLEGAATELRADRTSTAPLPETTFEARQRSKSAAQARDEADKRLAAGQRALNDAQQRSGELEAQRRALEGKVETERNALERARTALEAARALASDDTLAERRRTAGAQAQSARAGVEVATAQLQQRQPEALEQQVSNHRAARASLEQRLQSQREAKSHLDGRLESRGQEGLAEARDGVEHKLALARDELTRTRRRANAAKLLFDTLHEERERERRAYVAPLTEKIESLAQVVYGGSVRITLADDLSIAARTLEGRTVPFESLSTGAREQLGVITRLACAQIVSEDGGVPLILDDVLGHTDPERLDLMRVVLAQAGKQCQILLFTASPERYLGIRGAKFVELARA